MRLGDIFHESGYTEKALEYYEKALEFADVEKDPLIYPVAKKIVEQIKKNMKEK